MMSNPKRAASRPTNRTFWLCLAGLVLLAFVLRLLALVEFLHKSPFALVPPSDAWTYWQWAGHIAAGHIIGDTPFLSAPLYPYFVGLLRFLGAGLTVVRALQILLYLATTVLIAVATRRRYGALAGILAAAAFLLLEEPAASTLRLLANTLQLLLVALVWWRWVVLAESERPGWRDTAVLGALLGAATLSYPAMLLALPLYAGWLWWAGGRGRRALGQAALGLLTAVLPISLAALHNGLACGEFIPISAHSGITMLQGNAPDSRGVYTEVEGISTARMRMHETVAKVFHDATGRQGTWQEVDAYMRGRATSFWREQPARALRLFALKAYWFLTGRYYHEIMPYFVEREAGVADRALLAPLPTAWLMGLALAGFVLALRRPVRFTPEIVLFFIPLIAVILFFYSPRYRLPAVPVMCGLAAGALVQWRASRWRPALVIGLGLLPLPLAILNHQISFDTRAEIRQPYMRTLSVAFVKTGDHEFAEDRLDAAARWYSGALHIVPNNAMAHRQLGAVYAERHEYQQALEMLVIAVRDYREFRYPGWEYGLDLCFRHLYEVLLGQHRPADAAEALRRAIRTDDKVPGTHLTLAWILATHPDASVRNGAEAVTHAEAAQRLVSADDIDVLDTLGAAYAEAGRFPDAVSAAHAAARLADQAGDTAKATAIRDHIAAYERGEAWRAPPRPVPIP
ncbi:MAG: glycosyltransferase family 39 protein [Phycisphaerae bacterium]|jgi:tetratricopeptide (TPR) repeat protein